MPAGISSTIAVERTSVLAHEHDRRYPVVEQQRHDANGAGRADDVALEQLAVGRLERADGDVPDVALVDQPIAEVAKRWGARLTGSGGVHATDELGSSTTNRCGARDSRRASAA